MLQLATKNKLLAVKKHKQNDQIARLSMHTTKTMSFLMRFCNKDLTLRIKKKKVYYKKQAIWKMVENIFTRL